jgi:hypothetical protein
LLDGVAEAGEDVVVEISGILGGTDGRNLKGSVSFKTSHISLAFPKGDDYRVTGAHKMS